MNAIQRFKLLHTPTGGNLYIYHNGTITAAIAGDTLSTTTITTALEDIGTPGDYLVTLGDTNEYVIEFQGTLANTDIPLIDIKASELTYASGTPFVSPDIAITMNFDCNTLRDLSQNNVVINDGGSSFTNPLNNFLNVPNYHSLYVTSNISASPTIAFPFSLNVEVNRTSDDLSTTCNILTYGNYSGNAHKYLYLKNISTTLRLSDGSDDVSYIDFTASLAEGNHKIFIKTTAQGAGNIANDITTPGDITTDQIQTITLTDGPQVGTWEIVVPVFGTTSALQYNATGQEVEDALAVLGINFVTVDRSGTGRWFDPYVYTLNFTTVGLLDLYTGTNINLQAYDYVDGVECYINGDLQTPVGSTANRMDFGTGQLYLYNAEQPSIFDNVTFWNSMVNEEDTYDDMRQIILTDVQTGSNGSLPTYNPLLLLMLES